MQRKDCPWLGSISTKRWSSPNGKSRTMSTSDEERLLQQVDVRQDRVPTHLQLPCRGVREDVSNEFHGDAVAGSSGHGRPERTICIGSERSTHPVSDRPSAPGILPSASRWPESANPVPRCIQPPLHTEVTQIITQLLRDRAVGVAVHMQPPGPTGRFGHHEHPIRAKC